MAPPFEQSFIHIPKDYCVQYLRNLFSSFGEDFYSSCKQKSKFAFFVFLSSAKMPVDGVPL